MGLQAPLGRQSGLKLGKGECLRSGPVTGIDDKDGYDDILVGAQGLGMGYLVYGY
jgi:hypothetical protein